MPVSAVPDYAAYAYPTDPVDPTAGLDQLCCVQCICNTVKHQKIVKNKPRHIDICKKYIHNTK